MPKPLIALFVFVCILDLVILALPWLLARRGVMLRRTKFGPALVFDSEANGHVVRLLNVRGTFQSLSYTSDDDWHELVTLYHQYFAEVVDVAGGVKSACVIGGGGFSFPKWLVAHCPRTEVDVVEVDPAIIRIARESFFLDRLEDEFHAERDGRLRIACADGWEFLRQSDRRWDLVVNDAFSGKRPLGPMGTEEGARIIHEHLSDDGIYLANLICPLEGRRSRPLDETLRVFGREFSRLYLIPERPEEPRKDGDNVLVASDRALGISERYRVR